MNFGRKHSLFLKRSPADTGITPSRVSRGTRVTDQSVHDLDFIAAVESRVGAWLAAAAAKPVQPSAARLAGVLKDPHGLAFTVGFVDRVIRPEDVRVAARALRELVPITPAFLPWFQKLALRGGAT